MLQVLVASGAAVFFVHMFRCTRKMRRQKQRIQSLQTELQHEVQNRLAERSGRIKAEKRLRELSPLNDVASLETCDPRHNELTSPSGVPAVLRFSPIDYVRSCFSQRNGTPRQPLLVPLARAELLLSPGVPAACLDGLGEYSHCWVLYVFHRNTDLHRDAGGRPPFTGLKAKIHVPRLDGARMGVLATRSPHRPNPIGLSVAEVVAVGDGRVVLGGADIVDGTPVLDVKPYVPFCDSCPTAAAPPWVQAAQQDEPLRIDEVKLSPSVRAELENAWESKRKPSLHCSASQFLDFTVQVLSRDIRSLHQRTTSQDGRKDQDSATYRVVLDGVEIRYGIQDRKVTIRSGSLCSQVP